MTYRKTKDASGNASDVIRRIVDGACIPPDPYNTDYQDYLAWVADGNTPGEPE